MRIQRFALLGSVCMLAGTAAWAQVGRGGSEWLTAQADAQRTSWIQSDPAISVDTMSKPGFELQWKATLDTQSRATNRLLQGVTANGVTLFVPMSLVTGSANNLYAIDNDTGHLVWQRHFDAPVPAATPACAGGVTGAATRIVSLTPPAAPAARAGGAGGRGGAGYRSSVGEPGEGAPVEARGGGAGRAVGPPPAPAAPSPAAPPPAGPPPAAGAGAPPARGVGPAAAAAAAAAAPRQGGGGGRGQVVPSGIPGAPPAGGGLGRSAVGYAITSDGQLHVVGLQSGKDLQKPAPFLPANAQWSDAIAVNTTLYASTTQGCGGSPSGVWAVDLESAAKPVVSWKTNGGSIVGNVAFMTDGTLLVAVGAGQPSPGGYANAILALDPKTLQVKDWYTQPAAEFVTGPMVFQHKDKDLVAAATKDGRVLLLEGSSLGGANHSVPLHASRPVLGSGAKFATAALATWQETTTVPGAPPPATIAGTRWVLVPVAGRLAPDMQVPPSNGALTTGAVLALKLVEAGSAISLQPGWTSSNMASPATPIVVNGVVFALSTGRAQTGAVATPAVLHAYEGATGKALWNSRRAMTTAAANGSFWSALGQAYVGAADGTLYAFGFLDERR
ncbi:MAG: hypothetical protein ABIW19_03100 [Vicinamibacterales bacterium]